LERPNTEVDGKLDAQDEEDIKGVAGVLYGGEPDFLVTLPIRALTLVFDIAAVDTVKLSL